ncbi:hypothetical protein [Streptomyces sp. NPDC058758]|uniref:hypothetical protein n=1 Tax=Streptomyces sp. NPDC058758 TaxID=3346627 RepID=UPI00368828F7
MTDRPRLDQLTDDMLDQLYARLEHVEQAAGRCFEAGHEKDLDRWRHRAEKAEVAIARVRNWCDQLDTRTRELTGDPTATSPIAGGVRIVLDLPA